MQRLEELVGVLEAHPEEHSQYFWAMKTECGTTKCAAGWTVELWGSGIDWNNTNLGFTYFTLSGDRIQDEARKILGLNWRQVNELFLLANNLEDIKRVVKRIANGEL